MTDNNPTPESMAQAARCLRTHDDFPHSEECRARRVRLGGGCMCNSKAEVLAIARLIAEKDQQIADLKRELAEANAQIRELIDLYEANVGELPVDVGDVVPNDEGSEDA